jgi:hypothetical protein
MINITAYFNNVHRKIKKSEKPLEMIINKMYYIIIYEIKIPAPRGGVFKIFV